MMHGCPPAAPQKLTAPVGGEGPGPSILAVGGRPLRRTETSRRRLSYALKRHWECVPYSPESWRKDDFLPPSPTFARCRDHNPVIGSGEPALAPAVMLDLAVAFAPGGGKAEIELLHILVAAQGLRRAIHDDAAVLEDVAIIGIAQRDVGVLLGEQET